jgi:hypothetical protein
MARSDNAIVQAHLAALAQREAEAEAEAKTAAERDEKVRANAIAGELSRIRRRRQELLLKNNI